MTGTTKFTIREKKEFSVKVVEIEVYRPSGTKVGLSDVCPSAEKQYGYAARVKSTKDSYGHGPSVGSWTMVRGEIALYNGMMSINGDIPQFTPATGPVNCQTRAFRLMGDSGSTRIADFKNVTSEITGVLPGGSANNISGLNARAAALEGLVMTYVLGNGVFPNGPITYELEGTLDVDSGPCSYSLTPGDLTRSFPEGTGAVSVTTDDGCGWSASSDQSWLTIAGDVSGVGTSVLDYSFEENPADFPRVATITVAGETFTFTQEGSAATRPVIARSGVVNGASFESGIAPASWITIQGRNLASTTRIWGAADFSGANLPAALDDVRVTINGVPAYIFFISPTQLNVLAPDGVPFGYWNVVVQTATGSSDPSEAIIAEVDPALFKFDPEGRRYAAAVHAGGTFLAKRDLFGAGLNVRPASPGDFVLFFGTGFGPTEPPTPTSQLVSAPALLATPVVVRIGGFVAEVQFAGLVSSGLYQFNVVIPEDLEPGDHLVEIFIDGVPIQDGVYITVE